MNRRELLRLLAMTPVAYAAAQLDALAQMERKSAIYPLPGPYSFALRKNYNTPYRYLNVIDIGHGELAEVLITVRDEAERVRRLEEGAFRRVSAMFLDPGKAPRLAVHEETVAPESVKVAPRLNQAFDWAHILHRQIYDILATDFSMDEKKRYIRQSYNWYWSEPGRCFPLRLKSHDLMEHQWFSQYWRQNYPRFNGAIWAYHWYQLRLNEVMLEADKAKRDAAVAHETSEFRAMFDNPDLLPKHMPMAHTISPTFLAEFPDIANSFDNLHSFHDIYNDILAHPHVPDKRAEVYTQLESYLAPNHAVETAPMHPLPANLSTADHRRLNQLEHLEHMAMMLMPVADQLRFFRATPPEREKQVEELMPEMARHWPNFEKKHAEMGHHKHH